MAVILYLPHREKSGDHLLRIIRKAIPDHAIEIFSSVGDLSERLHRPRLDVSVAVLYAASRAELMEMIYLGDLLGELRVVLILPDGEPDILEKAYDLRPRFVAAAESDFKHLGSILQKMTNLYDQIHGEQLSNAFE